MGYTIMKSELVKVGSNQYEQLVSTAPWVVVFYSYNQPVGAEVGNGWDFEHYRTDTYYSQTTTRHLNNFVGKAGEKHQGAAKVVPQLYIDELVEGKTTSKFSAWCEETGYVPDTGKESSVC